MSDWGEARILGVSNVVAAAFTVSAVGSRATDLRTRCVELAGQVQYEPYGMRDFTVETPDRPRLVFAMPL